jgi:uroporphyrin-III C-methyltransferase
MATVKEAGFAALDTAKFPTFEPCSVWLVGAGPGAAGLLTLMGYYGLISADVVVYDALVGKHMLDWTPPGTMLEYAGKRGGKPSSRQRDISVRLIELASAGKRVLRLKGGDPMIFGRGGEECQALRGAGIPFRIVPGISSGVGGLAYAGIPTTHRLTNQSVTFLTGHDSGGEVPTSVDWAAISRASPVLVLYMAVKNLADIAAHLMAAGRSAHEPMALVAHATMPDQVIVEATLGTIGPMVASGNLPTPAIVVIGPVVSLRAELDWYVDALRGNTVG